ncbi:MAG: N-acetyl-gamma-glutamyl-phosphate reductase, partial [Armatimonadota bacterium]|nr:N-acetyl-gamma-glutamyl-phosphate reductase [Armatimonadota bacterium]
ELPQTKATYGSNFCDVTVRVDAERGLAVAVAALDNLVKGGAGQAVQNLNVMFGLPETTGLWTPALFP